MKSIIKHLDFYGKILEANLRDLDLPLKLNFAVSYDCNCRCKNCNIWRKDIENELGLSEIRRFFQKNTFFRWISLTGGEPFLQDDLIEIAGTIAEASKNLYVLNIPTNGSRPRTIKRKVRELSNLNIPKIILCVSVDGPPELHNRLRGKEVWDDAIRTYRSLSGLSQKRDKLEVLFSYTLSHQNLGMFEKTLDVVKKEVPGVTPEDFDVTFFHTSGHYYANKEGTEEEDFYGDFERINQLKDQFPKKPRLLISQLALKLAKDELKENELPCVAPVVSCFMDPEGNVYPCVIHDKEIGNMRNFEYSLKRLWEERVRRKYKSYRRGCEGCWLSCESNQRIMTQLPQSLLNFVYKKIR